MPQPNRDPIFVKDVRSGFVSLTQDNDIDHFMGSGKNSRPLNTVDIPSLVVGGSYGTRIDLITIKYMFDTATTDTIDSVLRFFLRDNNTADQPYCLIKEIGLPGKSTIPTGGSQISDITLKGIDELPVTYLISGWGLHIIGGVAPDDNLGTGEGVAGFDVSWFGGDY